MRIDWDGNPIPPERKSAAELRQEAEAGGDLGIQRSADRNARNDPHWRQTFYEGIVTLARTSPIVFCDDVWELTGLELPENSDARGVGSLFQKAARNEVIRKRSDSRKSVRSHMSVKPLWDSLIYKRDE